MNAFTFLLSTLAAAVFGLSESGTEAPEQRDADVLISTVTDDPCCGSGIVAVAIGVSGRAADGERSYFIPFMAPGQAKPRVGERCAIGWRRWQSSDWAWSVVGGSPIKQGREVTDFVCRKA